MRLKKGSRAVDCLKLAGIAYVSFALRRPEHFSVMFDAPTSVKLIISILHRRVRMRSTRSWALSRVARALHRSQRSDRGRPDAAGLTVPTYTVRIIAACAKGTDREHIFGRRTGPIGRRLVPLLLDAGPGCGHNAIAHEGRYLARGRHRSGGGRCLRWTLPVPGSFKCSRRSGNSSAH